MDDRRKDGLSLTEWLIVVIVALGFAFDSYELLALPLVIRPALMELGGLVPGSVEFNRWVGWLFYLPAICGGVFGLLGGHLADRFGRRRLLTWSIMVYAVASACAAYTTSLPQFLLLRCLVWIGISVEFVAGIAYAAETFPDPKRREKVLGVTQAFATLGGLMVSGAYYAFATHGHALPEIAGGHQAWRYTLLSGLVPAIPLLLLRPFLPESPLWEANRAKGTLHRARIRTLFEPAYRRTLLITSAIAACSFGIAQGGLQHVPRMVPGIEGLAAQGPRAIEQAVGQVQFSQEMGGLFGRLLFVALAVRIASSRRLLEAFQAPALLLVPATLYLATSMTLDVFTIAIFFAWAVTIAQFSFFGNYLPAVFPTAIRGAGESFTVNVGGRMVGAVAALLTTELASLVQGASAPDRLSQAAAVVVLGVCVGGLVGSRFLPDIKRSELPD